MAAAVADMAVAEERAASLEAALEYIEDDELVEITPSEIRLRKSTLQEAERRRMARVNS